MTALIAGRASRQIAVFIDVANALGVDWDELLDEVKKLGRVEEMRAYGDFRQHHLGEVAVDLYLFGIHLVHCPSWANGGYAPDGSSRRKRTDDRLLEKEARDLISQRPEISHYILVTADADVIPTLHVLMASGKEVTVLYPGDDSRIGHVITRCRVRMEPAPMTILSTPVSNELAEQPGGLSVNGAHA